MSELRECPFCGGTNIKKGITESAWSTCYCDDCYGCAAGQNSSEAHNAWNRRASGCKPENLSALIAAAHEVCEKSCTGDPDCPTCATEYVVPWRTLRQLEHAVDAYTPPPPPPTTPPTTGEKE